MGFAPRVTPESFRAAFTGAEGWGSFAQTRQGNVQRETIELRWGRLTLKSLAFSVPETWTAARVTLRANDKEISHRDLISRGRLTIELNDSQTLSPEDRLSVEIQQPDQS